MKMSDKGREILIHSEGGHRLKAYPDSKGIPTIGVGMTFYPIGFGLKNKGDRVQLGDELNLIESRQLFDVMLEFFEMAVDSLTTDKIPQDVFDALVHFTYNIGIEAYKTSELRTIINTPGYSSETAEREFFDWLKPRELVWRRHVEANLFAGRI